MNEEKLKLNMVIKEDNDGSKRDLEDNEVNDYFSARASQKMENEIEKSPRFFELIGLARSAVSGLAKNKGVKGIEVTNDMIHLLPHNEFQKLGGVDSTGGFFSLDGIYLDEDFINMMHESWVTITLCHELLHASSMQKVKKFEKAEDTDVNRYRSGFKIIRNDKVLFNGLNEGATDYFAKLCFQSAILGKFEFAEPLNSNENDRASRPVIEKINVYKHLELFFLDLCAKIDILNYSPGGAIKSFIWAYFNEGIAEISKMAMMLGPGALNHLAKITAGNDKDNLERIISFRKKYGLPEDVELNKYIETLKK